MRMILGLDALTQGSVTVAGRSYRDLPAPMREVGALLDAKALPGRSLPFLSSWLARDDAPAGGADSPGPGRRTARPVPRCRPIAAVRQRYLSALRPGGSRERLFGEVPEYQRVRDLNEAPAFADRADFDRRQAEGVGELGDLGAGLGKVAGDEDHAPALGGGHRGGEGLGGKLVEGLHDPGAGQDLGDVVRGRAGP